MDPTISLIIWVFIVIIVACITANDGVRYLTGIALGLLIAMIIMFALEDNKKKLSNVFMLGLLITFVYIILYVLINAARESSSAQ